MNSKKRSSTAIPIVDAGNLCAKIFHIVDLRCELRKTKSSPVVTNRDHSCQSWAFVEYLGILFAKYLGKNLGSFKTDPFFLVEKLGGKPGGDG